jgi:hypothetical protein
MRRRFGLPLVLGLGFVGLGFGCRSAAVPPVPGGMDGLTLANRFAYIPAQCYATTRDGAGTAAHNPCYACHVRSTPPNFVDDQELQLTLSLPAAAARNPWSNLFAPPVARAARRSDPDVLAYVRAGNYFDERGEIALARRLAALPPQWDGQRDGRWDGYVPDAWFRFDARGFDHAPDGRPTGWRAFAYAPLPGFFPTNGSMDDVLIRLDPVYRQDVNGRFDQAVYEANLAVVETLVKRVPSAARPALHYVGLAGSRQDRGELEIEPGLFPLGTEFLHTLRYLDVRGVEVVMAPRMKELRYAKKVRWLAPADLRAKAAAEVTEQAESADGVLQFLWQFDRGIYNDQGWLLQGFIEAADGSLRPQSYEESLTCVGCHGEIGATTDSIFSFARKLDAVAPAGGWFHWTQRGLAGLAEPRRRDGRYEYAFYLEANGAGDDLRDNRELAARFFDASGALRPDAVERLHGDIATLLVPAPGRALDLDRASWALARDQSFTRGRDPVLEPTRHAYRVAPVDTRTGIAVALGGPQDRSQEKSQDPSQEPSRR